MKELRLLLEQLRDLLYAGASRDAKVQCDFTERRHRIMARYPEELPLLYLQLQPLEPISVSDWRLNEEVKNRLLSLLGGGSACQVAGGVQLREYPDADFLEGRVVEVFEYGYLEVRYPLQNGKSDVKAVRSSDFQAFHSLAAIAERVVESCSVKGALWFRCALLNASKVVASPNRWVPTPHLIGTDTVPLLNEQVEPGAAIDKALHVAALRFAQTLGFSRIPS